jgi:hypothetical protein
MKKIGILFGQENTFPAAFVDRVNSKRENGITAEYVSIDKVIQGKASGYDVIIDRISQDVPFYRAYLKNAALCGTAVINNPFWWSADEKFFNNALMTKLNVAVPKTVLLPSNQHPDDTNSDSYRNLVYPMDWEAIFNYVGFPAFFKPFAGGGWKNVYRLENADDFFKAYSETGQLVMMLQEEINFTEYFRCYCIDRSQVHIMRYSPKEPHHLRYVKKPEPIDEKMLVKLTESVLSINYALGYDFNTVELAIRNGVPYAIDFCNPAPDADLNSVGNENFEWIVEAAADMAINRALHHKEGQNNLTWGRFIKQFAKDKGLSS